MKKNKNFVSEALLGHIQILKPFRAIEGRLLQKRNLKTKKLITYYRKYLCIF